MGKRLSDLHDMLVLSSYKSQIRVAARFGRVVMETNKKNEIIFYGGTTKSLLKMVIRRSGLGFVRMERPENQGSLKVYLSSRWIVSPYECLLAAWERLTTQLLGFAAQMMLCSRILFKHTGILLIVK